MVSNVHQKRPKLEFTPAYSPNISILIAKRLAVEPDSGVVPVFGVSNSGCSGLACSQFGALAKGFLLSSELVMFPPKSSDQWPSEATRLFDACQLMFFAAVAELFRTLLQ